MFLKFNNVYFTLNVIFLPDLDADFLEFALLNQS